MLLFCLVIAVGSALLLFHLALLTGVWLPDVFSGARHTLAAATLPSGHSFRVLQYWNHGDFYSTELLVQSPDGHSKTYLLDGDDAKSWRVPLRVEEPTRTAVVTLGGNRECTVHW